MKAPYWHLKAKCTNGNCATKVFTADRKKIIKTGECGEYRIERLVCPQCSQWGHITQYDLINKK